MRTLVKTLAAISIVVATASASLAREIKAARPITLDLGSFRGSAYYTVENGGYRVVATLAAVNSGSDQPQVIRMVTVLNPEQTAQFSVPGALGSGGRETTIAFSRRGDRIEVASADAY